MFETGETISYNTCMAKKETYHNKGTAAGEVYERLNFLTSNPKGYDSAVHDVSKHVDRKAKKYEILHDLITSKMGHHLFTETIANNIAAKAQYHRELANLLRSKTGNDKRKHLDQVYGLGIKMRSDAIKKEKEKNSSGTAKEKSHEIILKLVHS
jgi:hypothetical protein